MKFIGASAYRASEVGQTMREYDDLRKRQGVRWGSKPPLHPRRMSRIPQRRCLPSELGLEGYSVTIPAGTVTVPQKPGLDG
jgi:hypothetical protein